MQLRTFAIVGVLLLLAALLLLGRGKTSDAEQGEEARFDVVPPTP